MISLVSNVNEKNWQVSFVMDGLVVPEEGIKYKDDIIVRRCGKRVDEAQFIMRVAEEEIKNGKAFPKKFEKDIANILQFYALETRCHVALPSGYASTRISDETPFGKIAPKAMIIRIEPLYSPETVHKLSSALKYTLRAYESLKNVFEDSSRAFLRHGLKYYYMALAEYDIQRRVIDLFIALETLFSPGQETRYRISLRTALFLSLIGFNRKEVFETVYELYKKRSKIVHGVESVDVSWKNVFSLENYLRECFRTFLYLDRAKDEITRMLDESLYDEEARSELEKIVVAAYRKWKNERNREG